MVQKWKSWCCGNSSRDFNHHANFVSRTMALNYDNCHLEPSASNTSVQATAVYHLTVIWDNKDPLPQFKQQQSTSKLLPGTTRIRCLSSSNSSLRSKCYLGLLGSAASVQATTVYDLTAETTRIRCLNSSNNSLRSNCYLRLLGAAALVQATTVYELTAVWEYKDPLPQFK